MVAFRAVLLRSPVPLGGILIVVIETMLALTRHTVGFNLWADRVSGLTSASILVGVVAAGIAAVEANRWEHSNRTRLQTAARPRLLVRVNHAAAVLLPLFACYWLAVVIVAAQAAATQAYGRPSLLWLLSLGCAVLLAGSIGYAAGILMPYRWFVGPAVGVAFYVCYVMLIVSNLPYGVVSLFPANGNYVSVFNQIVTSTLLAQAVFFVGVSAFILLLIGFRRKSSARALTSFTAVAAVIAVAGGVVVSNNGQVTTGHNPEDFACVGERPVLCLNSGYSPAANDLHREFRRLNDLAAGTPLAATRLEQNVQGYGDNPSKNARSVYLEQWAAHDDLTFSVFRYVQKYGGSSKCRSAEEAFLEVKVDSWLSGYYESTAGSDADEISQRLAQLSPAQGAEWFRQNYRAYATCSLTTGDLP